MATTLTATQTTQVTIDLDADGVIDPGETVTTTVIITNTGGENATSVQFTEALDGMTLVNQAGNDINVSPIAFNDAFTAIGNTLLEVGNATAQTGPQSSVAGSVIANDVEFLGDTFSISAFDAASANGGTVNVLADGSFTYISAAGFTGADTFTYTITDAGLDGVAGNADDLTSVGTVTVTVTNQVWYVDNSAGAGGDGTSTNPFDSLADVSGASGGDGDGDIIYVNTGSGNYDGGITLLNNQTLHGEGTQLDVGGFTLAAAGTDPTIVNAGGNGVTLASGNTLTGLTVGDTTGYDIANTTTATVGTLNISNVDLTGTGGLFRADSGGAITATFDTATTTSSSALGVQLNNVTGNVTFNNASISGTTGVGVGINGGTANIDFNGTVTKTSDGRAIDVANKTGGTVSFDGAVSSTGSSDGINLDNNDNATINFTGALTINTSASNTAGFTAINGGIVSATGAGSTINSGTATALNIANTNIGAADVTFQSISSNGGSATGIILDTTGSSGGLHVTGLDGADAGTDADAGSGGTIANKTGADGSTTTGIGIYLNNTMDVQLAGMQLNDFQNYGIRGTGVNGFALDSSVINGANGTAASLASPENAGEGSVYFGNTTTDGLSGTASITDSSISGGRGRNVSIIDTSDTAGELHLTIDNVTFGLVQNFVDAGDALTVEARNAGTGTHVTVTNSDFLGAPGDLAEFVGQTGTTFDLIFQNNALSNAHAQNIVGGGGMTIATAGTMRFDVSDNTFRDADGSAITIQMAAPLAGSTDARSLDGTLDDNDIGVNGVASSGSDTGNGIFLSFADNDTNPKGVATLAITNNTILNYDGNAGIYADNTGGNYNVNLTITGNTTAQPGAGAFAGLALAAGAPASGDDIDVFALIQNNNFSAGDPTNANDIIVGVSAAASSITLSGATPGPFASLAAVETFLFNQNPTAGTVVDAYADNGATAANFIGSAAVPPLPTAPVPLLAAPDGVEAAGDDASDATGETPPVVPAGDDTPVSPDETPSATPDRPDAPTFFVDDGVLSTEELGFLVSAAVARWTEAGLTWEQLEALDGFTFEVAEMDGLYLGKYEPGRITLDSDGAGFGWFLDPTPLEDSEFPNLFADTRMQADPTGDPAGHYDLLTTIMHEMGHALGLEDEYASGARDDLMYGFLVMGERRFAADGQADEGTPGSIQSEEFLGAPIDIGTLPAGKEVTIQWQATVDAQTNQLIVDPSNTGEVSGDNFGGPIDTNTVVTALDTLTLSNLIFFDANGNSVFDGGDAGVDGVTLTLFADNGTTAGVLDGGDTELNTTTTAGGGLYAFAGLAPGNYILRVDQGNFDLGGALANLAQGSSPGNPDPDDNVDNDDNGDRVVGGGIVALPITLAYNTEPTAGVGNDTNTTLDIGVIDLPAVAQDDGFVTDEVTVLTGGNADVFNDNGSGADSDPDDPLAVTEVNGNAGDVGTQIALASGALLTLNSDGTFSYDPNGAFEYLPAAGSGASNLTETDTFTYTLVGGDTATVTVTVSGIDNKDVLLDTAGEDTLTGGVDDDEYHISNSNDHVVEQVGEGSDTVFAGASYVLEAGVEVELLRTENAAGVDAINLTGNAFAQTIQGNAGNNVLRGGGGGDIFQGFGGNDNYYVYDAAVSVLEAVGGGNDKVLSSVNYVLQAGAEVELLRTNFQAGTSAINLTGNAFAQTIRGNAGNNVLRGGGGADVFDGLGGNDNYYVYDAAVSVLEAVGGGNDKVLSSVNYQLAAGAEVELLRTNFQAGTKSIDLTGNAFAQTMRGNQGSNVLDGKGGTDFLQGMGGADTFVYDNGYGHDTAADYLAGADEFDLTGVSGLDDYADVRALMSEVGADVVITFNATNTLKILNTNFATLDANQGDFLV